MIEKVTGVPGQQRGDYWNLIRICWWRGGEVGAPAPGDAIHWPSNYRGEGGGGTVRLEKVMVWVTVTSGSGTKSEPKSAPTGWVESNILSRAQPKSSKI